MKIRFRLRKLGVRVHFIDRHAAYEKLEAGKDQLLSALHTSEDESVSDETAAVSPPGNKSFRLYLVTLSNK